MFAYISITLFWDKKSFRNNPMYAKSTNMPLNETSTKTYERFAADYFDETP